MRFLLRKKRQPPAVIIVALIDVLIVLLIFLMVTSSAKKPLSAVRLDLPESTQAAKVGANEAPPFLIVIEASGVLRYGENAKVVTSDELKQALLQAAAANPKLKVSISADKGAPWGRMVNVMDDVKEANIKIVSAFIKPSTAK